MQQSSQRKSKSMTILIALVIIGFVGFMIYLITSNDSVSQLPPTTMQGHIEQSPPSHISDRPMLEPIQKHMLEHVDGIEGGRPGVIIQYNCEDFVCEADLVDKLKSIVGEYTYVYLAPNDYDGKIILTTLGNREILEEFDEERIRNFIE